MTENKVKGKHRHEWTGLWAARWKDGRPAKEEHEHQCFDRRCHHILIGVGESCAAKSPHRVLA